jgi:hypothetical protein
MNTRLQIRNVVMILVGTAALLSKSWLHNSIGDLVHAYLGNLAASFAVFFVLAIAVSPKLHRIWIAAGALALVESFELTNGFGVMTNVYDPFDYLVNGLGIALAYCADFVSSRIVQAISPRS